MRPSQPPRRLALHSSQIPDDYLQQCTITSAASGGRKARTSQELTHVEGAYAEANEKAGTEEGRAIAEATFRQFVAENVRLTRTSLQTLARVTCRADAGPSPTLAGGTASGNDCR